MEILFEKIEFYCNFIWQSQNIGLAFPLLLPLDSMAWSYRKPPEWLYSTKQFFCYINYLSYRHNYILWWKECSLCIIHTFHKKRKSNPITFHIYVCVFLTSSCSRTYSRVHQGHSSRGGKTAPTISIFWDCHIRMHWNLILPKKSNPFCCSINSLSPQCSGQSYASVSMRKYLL